MKRKQYVYFNPILGGHLGILTVHSDGFLEFEIQDRSGGVDGLPETWGGTWERIGTL